MSLLKEKNFLHGEETTDTPREWKIQPSEVHFKYHTHPPKTSNTVLDIIGRLNNHDVDNGDVEVHL